jgi:hypothetical protein
VTSRLITTIRRLAGRYHPDPHRGDSFYYDAVRQDGRGVGLGGRWTDVALVADLRKTDTVLDVGAAEGLVAMEVARRVLSVHAIEVLEHRATAGREHARKIGIGNITFATGSVVDTELPPLAFDVTLFLGLYGCPTPTSRIGSAELTKALNATRRQIVLRVDVQEDPAGLPYLPEIYACFDALGFDGVCFPKVSAIHGNVILGNRRGAGARLPYLPPIALVTASEAAALPAVATSLSPETNRDPGRWASVLDREMGKQRFGG